nr:hypothetical protein [Nitrosomonas nitrosa]
MTQNLFALRVGCFTSLFLAIISTATAGYHIDWEVKNRYRAFDYKADGGRTPFESAKQFERYSPNEGERIPDWLQRIVRIQSPFSEDPGPWEEAKGIYKEDFVELPKHILIEASIVTDEKDGRRQLEQHECSWQIGGGEIIQQSCNNPLLVEDFDSGGAEVSVFRDGVLLTSGHIKPELKIILGLGDSYAAGEGNPDSPAVWRTPKKEEWPPRNPTAASQLATKPARWWSNRCDRSFYSYQNLVALRVAFDNPHAVVSFVHLACSGAEVIDGILAPQRYPPGHSMHRCRAPQKRSDPDRWDPECDVPYSQLGLAAALLCRSGSKPLSPEQIKEIKKPLANIHHNKNQRNWIDSGGLTTCELESTRNVDRVLLSIGGNDIGFSGLIANALMPTRSRIKSPPANAIAEWIVNIAQKEGNAVCPYTPKGKTPEDRKRKERCAGFGMAADLRIKELGWRYDALQIALTRVLHLGPERITVNLYPNPLRNEDGKFCQDVLGSEESNAWNATHILLPLKRLQIGPWQINLTEGEAKEVEDHVIGKLNTTIEHKARNFNWQVGLAQNAMKNHGWCTGENTKLLPFEEITEWEPYRLKPNTRFIRTANDSFLTQWPRTASETESRSKSIIERDNGFNGMFHPNAQGHASIACRLLLSNYVDQNRCEEANK